ncbi:MAG TPA: TetR/AcrR family transcriptional regulator [Polyangiales bacterium]
MSRNAIKREERRQQILDSARGAFAEKGYHGVTIDDVVARAEIARGTYYLYFTDKRAVLDALVDDFLQRIFACIVSIDLAHPVHSAREQLRQNIERVVRLALSEPAMVKIALRDATGLDAAFDIKIRGFYSALRILLDECLAEGQQLGLVRAGDRAIMVSIGLGGLKDALLDAISGELKSGPEALVAEIMRFLESGLLVTQKG